MGAWGIDPFDCDEGVEIREKWNEWLDGVHSVGYEEALKRFFAHWGDAINYGDTVTNNEIIALVVLHFEYEREVPKKLAKAAEDAINRELEVTEISSWKESVQQARKDFLISLLEKIGGSRKKPKNPNFFLDPALQFRTLNSAKKSLLDSFRKLKTSRTRIGLSGAGFPSFMLTLDRLMNHRIWEKDSNIYMQASNERLIMLATYIAIGANYTEDELKALIDRIMR
ncbi:MAG: hypothetical protein M0R33_24200 [Methylomonas sp.]|jgi:hypothetical protein|uniref:hypothetical protein n=1 Tax=Methylomonas sp. TaxID=418 RepID=UPI0025FCA3C6|nr:hypothetical protein [Methylomonas sp.]MCK9609543.1 hypothetical protein [Methylomonas sp.]